METNIENLLAEVSKCNLCPKLNPWKKFPADVHGNTKSNFMIVSEAPGSKSIQRGNFWKGQAGLRIRKILSEFNANLEDIFYLTDIVKCCPPENRTPLPDEIENCKQYLQAEIQTLKPKYIIVFGRVALEYFLSNYNSTPPFHFNSMQDVQNDSGYQTIEFVDFKIIPLLHPSRANQYMTYEIYRKHLAHIFQLLVTDKNI
jgi:uracil-DNA glycosylase family 4